MQELEALELAAWRGQLPRASEAAKRAAPLLFGIAGGLMQMVAIHSLQDSAAKAMAHQGTDARQRLVTGWAAMAGMFSEWTGNAIERLPDRTLRLGRGLLSNVARWLSIGGRAAGVFAGVVMAVLDAKSLYSEAIEGNAGSMTTAAQFVTWIQRRPESGFERAVAPAHLVQGSGVHGHTIRGSRPCPPQFTQHGTMNPPPLFRRNIEPRVAETMQDTPVVLLATPAKPARPHWNGRSREQQGFRYLTLDDELTLWPVREDPVGRL